MKNTISLTQLTNLPSREVVVADRVGVALYIATPMGTKVVNYKKVSRPIFGADSSYEKELTEVISEIVKIERASRDYLFDKWVEENKLV